MWSCADDPFRACRWAAQRLLGNAVLLTENGFGHLTINDPSRCVQK
jgi:TAP-like protein